MWQVVYYHLWDIFDDNSSKGMLFHTINSVSLVEERGYLPLHAFCKNALFSAGL